MRVAAIALVAAPVVLGLWGCGSGEDRVRPVSPPDRERHSGGDSGSAEPLTRAAVGRWRVRATVAPRRLGPIRFRIEDLGDLDVQGATKASFSIEHELVFRNVGNRVVSFADTRSSRFLGYDEIRLLAGDEGCGYALNRPGGRAEDNACRTYLDVMKLGPQQSKTRSISLNNGVPGISRLAPGRYVFRRPVRFRTGRRRPRVSERWSDTLRIAYEIRRR